MINGKIRLSGYKDGLKNKKLSYSEGLVFESKYSYDDGYHWQSVLASSNCSFCHRDELAAGLLNGLSDQGIKVPEDFGKSLLSGMDCKQLVSLSVLNLSQSVSPYDIGAYQYAHAGLRLCIREEFRTRSLSSSQH